MLNFSATTSLHMRRTPTNLNTTVAFLLRRSQARLAHLDRVRWLLAGLRSSHGTLNSLAKTPFSLYPRFSSILKLSTNSVMLWMVISTLVFQVPHNFRLGSLFEHCSGIPAGRSNSPPPLLRLCKEILLNSWARLTPTCNTFLGLLACLRARAKRCIWVPLLRGSSRTTVPKHLTRT